MIVDSSPMRNRFNVNPGSSWGATWWSQLLLASVLTVTACQGSVPTTSSDSINPTALDVDTSSVDLATPSTTTIANLDTQDEDLQETPALTPSTTSEPIPSFDADAVAAEIIESFDKFRLGSDDLSWYCAEQCGGEHWVEGTQYYVAEMANLRAYLIDMGMQPYDLQIEILKITEQTPGIAEATTRILHLGEPISNPGTQDLKLENGAWKGLNCDRRELKASWRCGEAFGELRSMCLSLWMDYVKDHECDLTNPDFFSQLYQLLTTSEEFSENVSEHVRDICGSPWKPLQDP